MGCIKFDEKEFQIIGNWPGVSPDAADCYGHPIGEKPKRNTPVTPKENFKLFMENKPYYWIPNMNADYVPVCPTIVPDTIACGYKGGIDTFGVEWIAGTNPMLPAIVKPGCPKMEDISEWHDLVFPDVDSWDWEGLAEQLKDLDHDQVILGIIYSGFFERLISLMDFEGAAIALVADPEETADFMEALCDYNISIIEHYKKYFNVDAVTVHDDWGAQRAPFFSRDTLKEVILPSYKRMCDRAHELGVYVITHCCGCSESFVPEMISAGSDIWQLQFNANPDLVETMKKVGTNLKFDIRYAIGEKEEADFANYAKKFYETYGQFHNAQIALFNEQFYLSPENTDLCYKLACEVY